jgi:hypothetical protein
MDNAAVQADRRLAHLGLAFSIVVVLAAIAFAVISAFYNNAAVALGFATVVLTIFPPLDQYLEIREVTVNLSGLSRRHADSLEEFSIPWYVLLAYGTVLLFMLHEVTSAIFALGFVQKWTLLTNAGAAMVVQEPQDLEMLIPPAVGMFFLGRWIAVRSARYSAAVIVGVALLGHLVALGAALIMSGRPWEPTMSGMMDSASYPLLNNLGGFLWWVVPTAAFFALFGLLGWWRGHSQRLVRYADYLLNRLPTETRLTVVTMLYEECGKSMRRPK